MQVSSRFISKITQTTKTKYIKSLFLKKNLSFWQIGGFIVLLISAHTD